MIERRGATDDLMAHSSCIHTRRPSKGGVHDNIDDGSGDELIPTPLAPQRASRRVRV
jgi:hypothetical protein